jgi:serine/threonine protein kinase
LKGRYLIIGPLGGGGMGTVWRGRDEDLDREVAIKVLRGHLADLLMVDRFRREARIAARLRHPGVTVVHDFGESEGQYFIVMELLSGRDLKAVLAASPAGLPAGQVLGLAIQAADVLTVAHEAGVVHRDLKPGNLFILDGGWLKVCDFGIARAAYAEKALTAAGEVFGTPAYMSPEQCAGSAVDARSDLYSLGCVLYEMLTGHPPFAPDQPALALMHQHAHVAPAAPAAQVPIREPLSTMVLKMLAKSPGDRPESAASVAAGLRQAAAAFRQPTAPLEDPGAVREPDLRAHARARKDAKRLSGDAPRRRLSRTWAGDKIAEELEALGPDQAALTIEYAGHPAGAEKLTVALTRMAPEAASATLCRVHGRQVTHWLRYMHPHDSDRTVWVMELIGPRRLAAMMGDRSSAADVDEMLALVPGDLAAAVRAELADRCPDLRSPQCLWC